MYKQTLWEKSGHWENYKNDMFLVSSSKDTGETALSTSEDGNMQLAKPEQDSVETTFGLKPMNCPGHCLLFASKVRSYHDLPIRYADFSPLHRDELSGTLTGLTRVRRFHQDDGHVFCRPDQVKDEIAKSIQFIQTVYKVLGIDNYRLVISTRPQNGSIGTTEEWARAEKQLEEGLKQATARSFDYNIGDGAFYGPKIDAITWDSDGKKHQIGTIQLDFQLPKRFSLSYIAGAPKREVYGEGADNLESGKRNGSASPVMIHRAVLGSLERFMAIFIEANKGKWPFWLNPNPLVVLTVTDNPLVQSYAASIVNKLENVNGDGNSPRKLGIPYYKVDLDKRNQSVAKKIALAKEKGYAIIVVIGEKDVKHDTVHADVSNIINQRRVWDTMETVCPGSQAPVQKDRGVGTSVRGNPGIKLTLNQLLRAIRIMTDEYI
ncbi:MAG: hypothetical protein Q9163_003774 [Psora crenata]